MPRRDLSKSCTISSSAKARPPHSTGSLMTHPAPSSSSTATLGGSRRGIVVVDPPVVFTSSSLVASFDELRRIGTDVTDRAGMDVTLLAEGWKDDRGRMVDLVKRRMEAEMVRMKEEVKEELVSILREGGGSDEGEEDGDNVTVEDLLCRIKRGREADKELLREKDDLIRKVEAEKEDLARQFATLKASMISSSSSSSSPKDRNPEEIEITTEDATVMEHCPEKEEEEEIRRKSSKGKRLLKMPANIPGKHVDDDSLEVTRNAPSRILLESLSCSASEGGGGGRDQQLQGRKRASSGDATGESSSSKVAKTNDNIFSSANESENKEDQGGKMTHDFTAGDAEVYTQEDTSTSNDKEKKTVSTGNVDTARTIGKKTFASLLHSPTDFSFDDDNNSRQSDPSGFPSHGNDDEQHQQRASLNSSGTKSNKAAAVQALSVVDTPVQSTSKAATAAAAGMTMEEEEEEDDESMSKMVHEAYDDDDGERGSEEEEEDMRDSNQERRSALPRRVDKGMRTKEARLVVHKLTDQQIRQHSSNDNNNEDVAAQPAAQPAALLLQPGELVFVHVEPWPPWPAVIVPEPNSSDYHEQFYHVAYLDDRRKAMGQLQRDWVRAKDVEVFSKEDVSSSFRKVRRKSLKARWQFGVKMAEQKARWGRVRRRKYFYRKMTTKTTAAT